MALPVPNLDDRTFQDIVNEARRRIPQYCPEWTDHNLSDPGITLMELFAWMTEMIIYRLNKVPDKNYVKFLELIGVTLAPAAPASTEVTFRLSAPQDHSVAIPMGTEVATVRTETDDAIVFTTTEPLEILPASLDHFLVTRDEQRFDDRLEVMRRWASMPAQSDEDQRFEVFAEEPAIDNAFYLGFESDLRRSVLSVHFDFRERGAPGIVPTNPPLAWEYWDADESGWVHFGFDSESDAWLEDDTTRGLNARGDLIFHIPRTAGESEVALRRAYWIRCRVVQDDETTGRYTRSPSLRTASAFTTGGAASASNTETILGEVLGMSDGKPGQSFTVTQTPMLDLEEGETLEVEQEDGSGWEAWQRVTDFADSDRDDKVYVADPVSGEIRLGPSIRTPSGEERRHGAVPPNNMHLRLTSYRSGGGPIGNVGPGSLTTLKSSIPYVGSTTNRRVASGGVDPESIDSAKMRGPQALRTLDRAVTEEDFEHLARAASPSVIRARCIQPREVGTEGDPLPGVVRVLLVPTLPEGTQMLNPDDVRLARELVDQVQEYLDERRLLTTVMVVSEPEYTWVTVDAKIKTSPGANVDRVRQAVERKLYEFIHPVTGGTEGNGWPFGRNLFASELYSQIQPVEGVEYVEQISVYTVDPNTGESGEPTQTLEIPRSGLLCSYTHQIECN